MVPAVTVPQIPRCQTILRPELDGGLDEPSLSDLHRNQPVLQGIAPSFGEFLTPHPSLQHFPKSLCKYIWRYIMSSQQLDQRSLLIAEIVIVGSVGTVGSVGGITFVHGAKMVPGTNAYRYVSSPGPS